MIPRNPFVYENERKYYSANWPDTSKEVSELDKYITCWMDPLKEFQGERVLDIGAGETEYTRLIAANYDPLITIAGMVIVLFTK